MCKDYECVVGLEPSQKAITPQFLRGITQLMDDPDELYTNLAKQARRI